MPRKVCSACKEERDHEEFNNNASKPDGLQDRCRPCDNARARAYYAKNKEKQKKQIHAARKIRLSDNQEWICRYLSEHPCADCGESDIRVLEFDHLRDKVDNVSYMLRSGVSRNRLEAEIAKCEVRCANCHNRKTHIENKSYRSRYHSQVADW